MRLIWTICLGIAACIWCQDSPGSSLILPKEWQPVLVQADFIGIIQCTSKSFMRGNPRQVFVKCNVEKAMKGATDGATLTLELGPAESWYGDPIPAAKKGDRFFVIAYCQWSEARPTPPADFFLTAYETGSWAPLPWSRAEAMRFSELHGSKHTSFEDFFADASAFLALSPDMQEFTVMVSSARRILEEKYSTSTQGRLSDEIANVFVAQNLQELIDALFSSNASRTWAISVLRSAAGPNALAIVKNEKNPNIGLSQNQLEEIEELVNRRWSTCNY